MSARAGKYKLEPRTMTVAGSQGRGPGNTSTRVVIKKIWKHHAGLHFLARFSNFREIRFEYTI